MCMFEPNFRPWGPFPTAEWAVFIQPEYFTQVVPWFMQRRAVKGRINAAGMLVLEEASGLYFNLKSAILTILNV